ncbi:MAG TPA: hypothetical protein VG206_17555 [Terriglobia bacterium]|nr:hypothetical protein [Terriglobia bacterium]
MTNTQLFFALLGVLLTVVGAQTVLLNSHISDPSTRVNQLIQYMIGREGRKPETGQQGN